MEDMHRSQFRLPGPLYEKLKDSAQLSGRSLNAEIVFRLHESFRENPAPLRPSPNMAIAEAAKSLSDPAHRKELEAILELIVKLGGPRAPG